MTDYKTMYECAVDFVRSLIRETNSKGEKILRLEAEIRELRAQAEELRFNPNHDPENGRFTSDESGGKGVDISGESGIIKTETNFEPLSTNNVVLTLREDSREWINKLSSEEIRAIKKYTKNSGDPKDDKFYIRLNSMLRGDIPEDDTLKYYSDSISGAIAKFDLKHDIICYRAVKNNPVAGKKIGDIYEPKQFISTAVVSSRVIKGNYNIAIMAKKGSKGAYIESLSKYPKQREFLFDKNVNYRILEIHDNEITLEVIT